MYNIHKIPINIQLQFVKRESQYNPKGKESTLFWTVLEEHCIVIQGISNLNNDIKTI